MPEVYYRPADRHLGNLWPNEIRQFFHRMDVTGQHWLDANTDSFYASEEFITVIRPDEITPALGKFLRIALAEEASHRNPDGEPLRAIVFFQWDLIPENGVHWVNLYYRYPSKSLGAISDKDYAFLMQNLVQEDTQDYEFTIDRMTFEFLHSQQMSFPLQDLLQKALDEYGEIHLLLKLPGA